MPKLRVLVDRAVFRVRINTVLGSGSPDDAVEVARAVTALGFDAKCSLRSQKHTQDVAKVSWRESSGRMHLKLM